MITRGLGNDSLILRGMGIDNISGDGSLYIFYRQNNKEKKGKQKQNKFTQRSKSATEFINELKEKILDTGVVKNTHDPYNSRTNRRFKVSKKQASRIAYSIAKADGYMVGKYRGPNKK